MTRTLKDLTPGYRPSVAVGICKGLLDFAVSKGASRNRLLERSGIAPEDIEDPDNRIPLERYAALMRAAAELCREPALALKFGEEVDIAEMTFVGLLGYAVERVEDSLVQLNRYMRLIVDVPVEGGGDRFRRVKARDGTWLIDARAHPNDFPEHTEATFARMVCRVRPFIKPGQTYLKEVRFTHPEPAYRREYDRIFQAPVRFRADRNAMLMDEAAISERILRPSRYAAKILSERAEAMLSRWDESATTRGQVEKLLIPVLPQGGASIDRIAAQMRLSRQTLYRRLRAEGVRFDQVLDEMRYRMALSYLNDKKASVGETASLVGFSEPSAFSRAFKRWTGKSPSRWAKDSRIKQ